MAQKKCPAPTVVGGGAGIAGRSSALIASSHPQGKAPPVVIVRVRQVGLRAETRDVWRVALADGRELLLPGSTLSSRMRFYAATGYLLSCPKAPAAGGGRHVAASEEETFNLRGGARTTMLKKNDESDAAARMMALFSGNEHAHGTHGEPYQEPGKLKWEIKKSARTLREPVTLTMWKEHVEGKRPLGIPPVREDGSCLWGSIDVDEYANDLLDVVARATAMGLVPGRSKSGGLHLFLLLHDPQPARAVQETLRGMAASLGLKKGTEIFPKQTSLDASRGDVGNWMVMPYFGDTFGGKIKKQVGLKKTGAEMTLAEFIRLAEKQRVGAEAFAALRKKPKDARPFSGGPECLRRAAADGVPGMRNEWLFNFGVYARLAHGAEWKDKIADYNQAYLKPPLSFDEVGELVKSLSKKKYAYRHDGATVCADCVRPECRGRYGIGGDSGIHPTILRIEKRADPPLYTVEIGEGTLVNLRTAQVVNYTAFNNVCWEQLDVRFDPMKQGEWDRLLRQTPVKHMEDEEGVGRDAVFREELVEFLVNRQKGERREDIWADRPWEDEEGDVSKDRGPGHYFRLPGLMKHVNAKRHPGERGVERDWVATQLKKIPGHWSGPLKIRGRGTHVWFVPSAVAQPLPEVEPPPIKGSAL